VPTLLQRFQAIEAALDGPTRYRDIRLDLEGALGMPSRPAGGGPTFAFLRPVEPTRDADRHRAQESQREIIEWGAEWLADFRDGFPREVSVAMFAGDRRGGKTFAGVELVIATCIDAPRAPDGMPLTAWIVAKSYRERFETEQWILQRIPANWYHHQSAPEHQFIFENGAILRLLSADDPDALKQGRVDIAFVNEPQKIQARAIAHVVLGASDQGGLVILAANPPSGGRGEWMFEGAIDDEAVARDAGKPVQNTNADRRRTRRSSPGGARAHDLIDPLLTAATWKAAAAE
jgi:hypothetical protein